MRQKASSTNAASGVGIGVQATASKHAGTREWHSSRRVAPCRDCEWFPYERSGTCLHHSRAHGASLWSAPRALSVARDTMTRENEWRLARRPTIFAALFVVSITLSTGMRSAPAVPISPEAESHLNEIVAVLQREWVHRDKMDWDIFRRRVFERAGAAQTIPDTYDAIRLALTLLGDKHTYYRTAGGENMWNPGCRPSTKPIRHSILSISTGRPACRTAFRCRKCSPRCRPT